MLYHLSYVSEESSPMTSNDLKELLEQARDINASNDITGLLLHREDSFLQVLEGDKDKVLETYVRIEKDPRHKNVKVLFSENLEDREFNEWSMAFVNLDGITINEIHGFSDFLVDDQKPREFLEELTRAKQTLLLFRAMN